MVPTNSECLQSLQTIANKDVEENQDQINQEIENFESFYKQYGVPEGKIFLSGVVSAAKIMELCNGAYFLSIQLAKGSNNTEDVSDFKFIISQFVDDSTATQVKQPAMFESTADATSALESTSTKFIDAVCCKNPPGTR